MSSRLWDADMARLAVADIEEIFRSLESDNAEAVKDLEDRGLIGPLEFIPQSELDKQVVIWSSEGER